MQIQLANSDAHCIIDDDDWNALSHMTFTISRPKGSQTSYVKCYDPHTHKREYLHRIIMPTTMQIDHIDGNALNNRRCNLRTVSSQQNQWNKISTIGVSKYKGVCWKKTTNRWQAGIKHNRIQKHLGYFMLEEDAARAYDKAALELFGEYARLNLPNVEENEV